MSDEAASPMCAADTAERLSHQANAVICLLRRDDFVAVGRSYRDFAQTSDAQAQQLLDATKEHR